MSETNPDQSGGGEDEFSESLEGAFKKAWDKKEKKGGGEHVFPVDKIHVKGTNPISGYKVKLGD